MACMQESRNMFSLGHPTERVSYTHGEDMGFSLCFPISRSLYLFGEGTIPALTPLWG